MAGEVLFEQDYRGNVWRFEITHHKGSWFLNVRKWYEDRDDGTLRPTREGVTVPLARLRELQNALRDYLDRIGW